jgi:hypothetical protein
VRRALDVVQIPIASLIHERRRHGWRSPLSAKLDRAFDRLSRRIGEEFPDLAPEVRRFGDLVCVLSDLEPALFPKWFMWALEELVLGE